MNLLGAIHRYAIQASCATLDMIFKETSPFVAYNGYLSKTSCGSVLQIWRDTRRARGEQEEMHTDDVEMYIADLDKQQTVRVRTLGDDALFIGHNYTCCLSTQKYPKLLRNHVYFTDDDEYSLIDAKDNRRDVGILNLEDLSVTNVVSHQPWSNWPIPVWVTPSFNKIHK
uniref:KIB1-4 beta-propeller domain-containing protein n=1 Tax=Hordeum vulgare subsp. vulgare TaxID=112509 RepID=A0A8I6XNW5_HORVV